MGFNKDQLLMVNEYNKINWNVILIIIIFMGYLII